MQLTPREKQDFLKSEFFALAAHVNDRINTGWLGSPMNYFILEAYAELCAPELIKQQISPLNGHKSQRDHLS